MKKIILILGASSDLGIAFINSQIDKYDYVIAHYYRNIDALLKLQKSFPQKISLIKADFSNREDVERFVDKIKNGVIPNYIIHFPAVRCKLRKFNHISISDFKENIHISVDAVILILQNLLPLMEKDHYGKIVFVLSIHTATKGHKYISDYMTAKYALLGLMKSLAMEYKEKGIRINGVSPDVTETKFISELPQIAIESKKLLTVSDIIPTIAYLLDEASDCLFGENICLTQ